MSAPIDFWFDYSSPYGYLASERVEPIAARHGRDVVWRPILLGAIFKRTGGAPLTSKSPVPIASKELSGVRLRVIPVPGNGPGSKKDPTRNLT